MLKTVKQDDDYIQIETEDYGVVIKENDQGLIVDQYFKDGDIIRTDTHWKHLDYPSVYKKGSNNGC